MYVCVCVYVLCDYLSLCVYKFGCVSFSIELHAVYDLFGSSRHIHTHIYIHTYIYIYTYTHIHTHIYIHIILYTYAYTPSLSSTPHTHSALYGTRELEEWHTHHYDDVVHTHAPAVVSWEVVVCRLVGLESISCSVRLRMVNYDVICQ